MFTLDTKIDDVINTKEFAEYGNLLFPLEEKYYDGSIIGDLKLLWYNWIDNNETVKVLNFLLKERMDDKKIFYYIYSKEEMEKDPNKKKTGLFFFRGNKNAPFAICSAGGNYEYVGALHDSFPHCIELANAGFNAFGLIYRKGEQEGREDLARAIAFVHENAKELKVRVKGYSLWGGSAGAKHSIWLGSHGTETFGEEEYPLPSTVVLQYTSFKKVFGNEPPTYICMGTMDEISNINTMQERMTGIKKNGTDVIVDIFEGMPHGFGLGRNTIADGWINTAIDFWKTNIK